MQAYWKRHNHCDRCHKHRSLEAAVKCAKPVVRALDAQNATWSTYPTIVVIDGDETEEMSFSEARRRIGDD